jgi:hypothetical protein
MERKTLVTLIVLLVFVLASIGYLLFNTDRSQINFQFSIIPCNGSNFQPSEIVLSSWQKDQFIVNTNLSSYCGGATISGDYELSGNNLTLYYKINAGQTVTKCVCTFEGIYRFSNIPKQDYNITLMEHK